MTKTKSFNLQNSKTCELTQLSTTSNSTKADRLPENSYKTPQDSNRRFKPTHLAKELETEQPKGRKKAQFLNLTVNTWIDCSQKCFPIHTTHQTFFTKSRRRKTPISSSSSSSSREEDEEEEEEEAAAQTHLTQQKPTSKQGKNTLSRTSTLSISTSPKPSKTYNNNNNNPKTDLQRVPFSHTDCLLYKNMQYIFPSHLFCAFFGTNLFSNPFNLNLFHEHFIYF